MKLAPRRLLDSDFVSRAKSLCARYESILREQSGNTQQKHIDWAACRVLRGVFIVREREFANAGAAVELLDVAIVSYPRY
jgi:hypothetical protein